MRQRFLIIAHGGAGERMPAKKALKGLADALAAGFGVLERLGSALDAAVETVARMEDSGLFNAGAGANLQLDGIARLDASVMEGAHLNAGAVIGLEGYRNAVKVARTLMDMPSRVMTNRGAARVASVNGIPRLGMPGKKALERLELAKRGSEAALYNRYFSTVGALALDGHGHLAAASSTGGVLAMLPGRVGDTPIIGSGTYADAFGAAVSTGTGEDIMRLCLAKEACMRMRLKAPGPSVERALKALKELKGMGGMAALDRRGRYAIIHTTRCMAAGVADIDGVRVQGSFWRL